MPREPHPERVRVDGRAAAYARAARALGIDTLAVDPARPNADSRYVVYDQFDGTIVLADQDHPLAGYYVL